MSQRKKTKKKGSAAPIDLLPHLPTPVTPTEWLDDEARALLRQGAMRLLRAVACVDEDGNELPLDPRYSKDAIQAFSMLCDRIPDVLHFEERSTGAASSPGGSVFRALDLLSPEGRAEVQRATALLPRGLSHDD